jgi:hypothetical protein
MFALSIEQSLQVRREGPVAEGLGGCSIPLLPTILCAWSRPEAYREIYNQLLEHGYVFEPLCCHTRANAHPNGREANTNSSFNPMMQVLP